MWGMQKIIQPAVSLNVTRQSVKRTVEKLIEVHRQTIADVEAGKKFYRRGDDISREIQKRCEHEIECCQHVLTAIDYMKAGDIKRAADLCSQIQAHLPQTN